MRWARARLEVPHAVRSAYDRIAPMIRFFRHGDGALALFNGGTEGDPRTVAGLLARDEVRGQPFAYARHTAYQRMTAGKTLLLLDCGTVPPGPFSCDAHAGCLAFEFSSAGQRIVVNCGAAGASQPKWESALRATAAHSTLVVADASMAAILPPGFARTMLGPRLLRGPTEIETRRVETAQGWSVEASHDGYMVPFGIRHERQITLVAARARRHRRRPRAAQAGQARKDTAFAIRFHVHPDVRMSPSQGGAVLLKLPNGEGWRFRSGAPVSLEESVYLGGDQVRRTEQIVLSGSVKDQPVEVAWVFEQIGTS